MTHLLNYFVIFRGDFCIGSRLGLETSRRIDRGFVVGAQRSDLGLKRSDIAGAACSGVTAPVSPGICNRDHDQNSRIGKRGEGLQERAHDVLPDR